MERYIGLDAHSSSSTFAVIGPTGRRIRTDVVETNAKVLVEYLHLIPGDRYLCTEEGTLSAWLYEVLSPHVKEMVVAGIMESRRGQKSDERDAFGLGEKLRTGAIEKRVYKKVGPFGKLRELVKAHDKVLRDSVRAQSRLKSLFRSRGIGTSGQGVYGTSERVAWLKKLPPSSRLAAETLYAEHDALLEIRNQAEKHLVKEVKRHPITKVLMTCPGMGPIRVAQVMAVVVSPHRFRTKRQFWSYCGFGIVMRTSSDWVQVDGQWVRAPVMQTRGLSRSRNGMLKGVFKGAATSVIGFDNPFHEDYERLLVEKTKPNLAKLTIARKIAATVLAMWKKQEVYDPAGQLIKKK